MPRFVATLALLGLMAPGLALGVGAIAVDDEEGMDSNHTGYGIAFGKSSTEAASKEAMKQCASSGNTHCRVVLSFDRCGAYAVSTKHYGAGAGSTEAKARAAAMQQCGQDCKVVVADCE